MTALWIILAIALALTLLNLLPVGVDAAYAEGAFSLAARIGPARLHLLPKAPDAKPGKAKTKKPKKKKENTLSNLVMNLITCLIAKCQTMAMRF